ncbi:hypothetical protein RMCBS344292_17334 [Rhizopus microsporus]|nr:hypothetical protein RMCBS344292_17334 [Rhizopus microsporus]
MPTLQNGRFERHVRGRTNARRIKAFPFISSQGHHLPISLTGFRVERGPESLLKADAVCSGTTLKTRYSLSLLSERHLPLGKIDERNEEDYQNSNKSFNITGLLALKIGHEFYNHQILPLGGKPNRENDVSNPSNRRSFTACSTSSTEPNEELKAERQKELGRAMPAFQEHPTRLTMVGKLINEQERFTNPYDIPRDLDTSSDNTRRCFKHGLGSEIGNTEDFRILDKRRKRDFNKCKGTEDDLLCFKTSRTKRQKLDNTTVLRQPNCPKIRNEGRRNSIVPPPDSCTKNSGTNERLQPDCPVPLHSRSRKHQGRSVQPEETPKEMAQDNRALLGETNDRRFCYPTESPSESILELVTGSGGSSHRRIQPRLAEEGFIPPLTMETDSKNTSTFQETTRPRSSTDDTIVDNTVLASYDLTDDTLTTNCDE